MRKLNERNQKIARHSLGNSPEFEIPSWDQIYTLLLNIAGAIRKSEFEPDVIVGVSRGGWLPARILSDLLENPNLANITTEFYVGVSKTKGKPLGSTSQTT